MEWGEAARPVLLQPDPQTERGPTEPSALAEQGLQTASGSIQL
jgi:hypothetical protein